MACSAERQLADLVEEQRAAVGQLEAALALRDGAGERALLVTEQLALEQRLGQRRAVDRHERAGARRAEKRCSARATTSLPVPVSPVISTDELVCAAAIARRQASRISALDPTTTLGSSSACACARGETGVTGVLRDDAAQPDRIERLDEHCIRQRTMTERDELAGRGRSEQHARAAMAFLDAAR